MFKEGNKRKMYIEEKIKGNKSQERQPKCLQANARKEAETLYPWGNKGSYIFCLLIFLSLFHHSSCSFPTLKLLQPKKVEDGFL